MLHHVQAGCLVVILTRALELRMHLDCELLVKVSPRLHSSDLVKVELELCLHLVVDFLLLV